MKSKLVCGKEDWTYIMILAFHKSDIFVKSEIRALEVMKSELVYVAKWIWTYDFGVRHATRTQHLAGPWEKK